MNKLNSDGNMYSVHCRQVLEGGNAHRKDYNKLYRNNRLKTVLCACVCLCGDTLVRKLFQGYSRIIHNLHWLSPNHWNHASSTTIDLNNANVDTVTRYWRLCNIFDFLSHRLEKSLLLEDSSFWLNWRFLSTLKNE